MSSEELEKYLKGATISNHTDWNKDQGKATDSKGVCFFPADPKPESRLHYLSGVVTFDKVVEFSPCGNLPGIRMTHGTYRKVSELALEKAEMYGTPLPTMKVDEICMPKYSFRTLYPSRIGTINIKKIFNGDFVWQIDWLSQDEMRIMRGHTWDKGHVRKERMA